MVWTATTFGLCRRPRSGATPGAALGRRSSRRGRAEPSPAAAFSPWPRCRTSSPSAPPRSTRWLKPPGDEHFVLLAVVRRALGPDRQPVALADQLDALRVDPGRAPP